VQTITKYFCKSPAETKTSSSWTAEGRVPSPRGLVELEDETINETGKKRRPERQQVNCQFQREEKQCYSDKIQQQNITRSRTRSKSNIKSNFLGQRHSLRSGRLQQVLDREGQAPTPFGLVSLQIKKSADSKQTKSANKKLNKKNQNVLKFEGKWRLNMERRGP
jgi:hypothetical protein